MKKFSVLIVAAGEGSRMCGKTPKQFLPLVGQTILECSIAAFSQIERCAGIAVVISKAHRKFLENLPSNILQIEGGATRRESVYNGLCALNLKDDDLVLIHDAARPLTAEIDICAVAAEAASSGAASLGRSVTDTLFSEKNGYIDRNKLWAIQTPQAFHYGLIKKAHETADSKITYTDDTGLVSAMGFPVSFVASTSLNFKITVAEDLVLAEKILSTELSTETRTGQGYDVHAFDEAAHKVQSIRLCGVDLPFDRKLTGHSDADVGLHALTDAILGAIGEGDIGLHFPPSDMSYKNMDSTLFLKRALMLMRGKGGRLINADLTLICEAPKIGPYRDALRTRVAEILEIAPDRVNIKATTTEKLGFTGRMEGIAAQAVASVSMPKGL